MPNTVPTQLKLDRIQGAEHGNNRQSNRLAPGQSHVARPEPTGVTDGPRTSGDSEVTIRHIVDIVVRRRNMIAATTVVGTALLLLVAWITPPKYTALAQIEVIKDDTPELRDTRAMQMMVDRHLVLLKSPDFLRTILDTRSSKSLSDAGIRNTTIEEFEKHLSVNQALSSNVIGIRYTSRSSSEAADIANRIVGVYREQLELRREARAKDELADLSQRAAKLRTLLDAIQASKRSILQNGRGRPAISAKIQEQNAKHTVQAANAAARELVSLLRRQRDLRQRIEAMRPEVRVVSMASPPSRPSSLHPILLVIPGVVALVAAGCFFAIVLEHLDQGMRSSNDITNNLAVPCAGLIPRPKRPGLFRRSEFPVHDFLKNSPFSPYSEAIRSVTASIGLATPENAPQVVLLSCSEPGEGKTALAVTMADYATSIGCNVLLVDLDVRMPGVLSELKCVSEFSIVDVINDGLPVDSVIERHPQLEFDFLPMAAGAIDPLSLTAKSRLNTLFDELRPDYDLILVDGPSAIGHSDAGLLAALADKVVFVVKWGRTRGRVAANAIQTLASQDPQNRDAGEFITAIVTHVPQKAHAQYRFGDAIEILMKHGTRLLPSSYTSQAWKAATRNRMNGAGRTVATLTAKTAKRMRHVGEFVDRQ